MAPDEGSLVPPPDMSHIPLAGVVLCCTSIPPEQRSELSTIAAEMGAASKLDLTSDVTHLIVGDVDTPKYKYVAKERPDVKCLLPQWVQAVREAWVAGEELDVGAFEEQYKLPTFMGLKICVTGFEDLHFRKWMEDAINSSGAEYRGDLTKEVTHLVASTATGQKYKYAKQWGIKVVALEWFSQSLERGMVLEESLYDPLMETHERGKGAWTRRTPSTTSLGKRRREDENPMMPGRKLRRSASSKFDSQNDGFWTDIVTGPSRKPELDVNPEQGMGAKGVQKTPESENTSGVKNPFEAPQPAKPPGLLADKTFYLHGFDEKKSSILEKHLSSHEAKLVSNVDQLNQLSSSDDLFVLVPHTTSLAETPDTPTHITPCIVTDFWLEKCLHRRSFIDPSSNILCSTFKFPVEDFDQLTITSTAFEGIDLLHLSKVIKLIGAKYDEFLTQHTSVLVCNDSSINRDKTKGALEWRIPAVNADWLWDSIRSGQKKDFTDYLLFPKAQQQAQSGAKPVKPRRKSSSTPSSRGHSRQETPAREEGAKQNEKQLDMVQTHDQQKSQGPFMEDEYEVPFPPTDENGGPQTSDKNPFSTVATEPLSRPEPLKERSPNSPQRSPSKPSSDAKQLAREALTDTLASILAQEKINASNKFSSAEPVTTRPSSARRERKLLGRAISNQSNRSGGALSVVGLTRESSIDTMNTDGLGTPIEPHSALSAPGALGSRLRTGSFKTAEQEKEKAASAPNATTGVTRSLTTSALTTHDELLDTADEDDAYAPAPQLQMTQVGYEELEAGRWRARLMRKIAGGKDGDAVSDGEDEEEVKPKKGRRKGVLEDEGFEGLAVGRRTRARLARS